MTSDASTQPRAEEEAPAEEVVGGASAPGVGPAAEDAAEDAASGSRRARRRHGRARDTEAVDDGAVDDGAVDDGAAARAEETDDGDRPASRRRDGFWVPLVPVLAVLLLLLLGGVGYLWFTRPAASSVRTSDYVAVLTQGRQDVVDLTSFDYQTIDQDIAQVRRISVGDLQKESLDLLQQGRQQITAQQAVVNTQVVSAAVTQAGDGAGRLMLVIETTKRTKASSTPTVSRYRIQADLTKVGDRWLLTGITGR